MKTELHGNLELITDPSLITAQLVYTVNPSGPEWNREKIFTLLRENNILDSVNPMELEEAIQAFLRQESGTVKIIIAQGLAPEPSHHGIPQFEQLPVPAEEKDTIENILDKAGKPVVYEWKEKHQIQSGTKDKNAGQTIRKKVFEKSTVPPENVSYRIGFAQRDMLVAVLTAPKHGLPGRNIYGDPILPLPAEKKPLYYSEGFSFSENKLYAAQEGILRIGENWVELIPYQKTSILLHTPQNNVDLYMNFIPGSDSNTALDFSALYSRAKALGFEENELIPKQELKAIIETSTVQKEPLNNYSILQKSDRIISINISKDKLLATITLKKSRGNVKRLSLTEIGEAMKSKKITQMNIITVKTDILAFFNSKDTELLDYPLARGVPPSCGVDGTVEWYIDFLQGDNKTELIHLLTVKTNTAQGLESDSDFPISTVKEFGYVSKNQKIGLIKPAAKGNSGKDVFGEVITGTRGKEYPLHLLENIKKTGYYLTSEIQGIAETGEKNNEYFIRIRPHEDSYCEVDYSDDRMKAFLTIHPAKGAGKILTAEKISAQIRNSGITFGIQETVIAKTAEWVRAGKPVNNICFAYGIPPVHSQGQRFILHVDKKEKKRVKILQDDRADYKTHDTILMVKKDQLLAEINPPNEEPKNGTDISGKTIIANQQTGSIIPKLINIRRVPQNDGVIKLYAEIDGEFIFANKTAAVKNLHLVKGSVGSETGNIKFSGSVVIKGGVRSGYKVISAGDLSIADTVEECLLSADGDIILKKGVKGGGKAVLRARGSIYCLFAEHAVLLSVDEIRIEKSALQCTIKCNSGVIAGKDKGTIMGGTIKAKKGLNVYNLGSVSEVKTTVSFGQDYLIGDQIEIEEKELSAIQNSIIKIDNKMKFLNKTRQEDLEILLTLREEKLQLLKLIEKHNVRLFTLREKFEEHFPAAVVVRGTIYPGVVLESHSRLYTVKENKTGVKFVFNARKGKIEEESMSLTARTRIKPDF